MSDVFSDIVVGVYHITNSELQDKLKTLFRQIVFSSGSIIQDINKYQKYVSFLISGIVRCSYISCKGQDTTDSFIIQPGYPVMEPSINLQSMERMEAVGETRLYSAPIEPFFGLMEDYPELLWAYQQATATGLFFHWQIKVVLQTLSAAERYAWFLKNFPGVDSIAKSRDIASFLGITKEHLSRIRTSHNSGASVAVNSIYPDHLIVPCPESRLSAVSLGFQDNGADGTIHKVL